MWTVGNVPTVKELAALVLAVCYSHRLTPQQNENEVTKTWPPGYKVDRARAQKWARELKEGVVDVLEKEHCQQLMEEVEAALKVHPEKQQRDLPETPHETFYHDLDHERRATG